MCQGTLCCASCCSFTTTPTFFSTFCEGPSVRMTGRKRPAHASTKLNTASDTGLQGPTGMGLSPRFARASFIHQMLMDSCRADTGKQKKHGSTFLSLMTAIKEYAGAAHILMETYSSVQGGGKQQSRPATNCVTDSAHKVVAGSGGQCPVWVCCLCVTPESKAAARHANMHDLTLRGPGKAPRPHSSLTHLEEFIKHFRRLSPSWSTWNGCAEHHRGNVAWKKLADKHAHTTANTVDQQQSGQAHMPCCVASRRTTRALCTVSVESQTLHYRCGTTAGIHSRV